MTDPLPEQTTAPSDAPTDPVAAADAHDPPPDPTAEAPALDEGDADPDSMAGDFCEPDVDLAALGLEPTDAEGTS